ncbi:MAG: hypothetical protein HPY45_14980 [Anaerolineae bacterium]|nr:hypothetical protein [Anaerolineae bacterium]
MLLASRTILTLGWSASYFLTTASMMAVSAGRVKLSQTFRVTCSAGAAGAAGSAGAAGAVGSAGAAGAVGSAGAAGAAGSAGAAGAAGVQLTAPKTNTKTNAM